MIEVIIDENKDRCVVATRNIKKGTVILCDHVAVFDDMKAMEKTKVDNYAFQWDSETYAISLGISSLINHYETPNVEWVPLFEIRMMEIVALRDIKKGEELVFSYGNDLSFEPVKPLSI